MLTKCGDAIGIHWHSHFWAVWPWPLTFGLHDQSHTYGGTGVRELTRSLATLPPKVDLGAFRGQRQGRPPRGPSGSALLLCV